MKHWSFYLLLDRFLLFSATMKLPALLLATLLFSQSSAFEFIIDGEWEDEVVSEPERFWKLGMGSVSVTDLCFPCFSSQITMIISKKVPDTE